MSRLLRRIGLLLPVLCGAAMAAGNLAEPTLVYPCRPATGPITIDGRLEPAEWEGAVEVSGFWISGSEKLASEQVVMRLLYDQRHLYVAVKCLESNMKGIVTANATMIDGPFWLDDSIEFFLDPAHSHEQYWQFAATAKGVRYDNQQGDPLWNSSWRAAAQQHEPRPYAPRGGVSPDAPRPSQPTQSVEDVRPHAERGDEGSSWTVEAAVPFADLRVARRAPLAGERSGAAAPAPGTLWGFNLCREREAGGRLELFNWADVQRVFANPPRFGHLYFVEANWQPTEATIAAAARDAGGRECVVFVADGQWRAKAGQKPQPLTYRALLRGQEHGALRLMEELRAIYQKNPQMTLREEFSRLEAACDQTKALIAGDTPIRAETWASAKSFLDGLQDKVEAIYWRVRVVLLNESF